MAFSYNELLLLWLRNFPESYTRPLAFPADGTRAQLVGAAGPFAPADDQTLLVRFNGAGEDLVVRFAATDTTAAAVAARINAAALGGFADLDGAGAIRLNSILLGLASRVQVRGGTLAVALGFPGPYPQTAQGTGDPTGFDLFSMQMAMLGRVAEAGEITAESMYVLPWSGQKRAPASGGVRASGLLRLTRTDVADEILVPVGTPFDAPDGTRFLTTANVTFAAAAAGPLDVAAEASSVGFSGNVPAGFVDVVPDLALGAQNGGATVDPALRLLTDSGRAPVFLPQHVGLHVRFVAGANTGTIARINGFVAGPPNSVRLADGPALVAEVGAASWVLLDYLDLTFSVTNPDPTAGGRDATLDAIGEERLIPRRSDETDDSYRPRVANLPDTVSPNAILRTVNAILRPYGRRARLREVGVRPDFPGLFADVDAADYSPAAFRVLVDAVDMRGFFLVGLPRLSFADSGAAFDVDAADDGAADGTDPEASGVYRAIFSAVDAARAGGVGFLLVQEDDL